MWPVISRTSFARAASTSASASATELASGFSTRQCSPALSACSATLACTPGGVAMTTASWESSSSLRSVAIRQDGKLAIASRNRCSSLSITVTSTSGRLFSTRTCLEPQYP
ncbi:MAG TPA: hypothetical protein VGH89_28270 [Pseudonocardia sp.]